MEHHPQQPSFAEAMVNSTSMEDVVSRATALTGHAPTPSPQPMQPQYNLNITPAQLLAQPTLLIQPQVTMPPLTSSVERLRALRAADAEGAMMPMQPQPQPMLAQRDDGLLPLQPLQQLAPAPGAAWPQWAHPPVPTPPSANGLRRSPSMPANPSPAVSPAAVVATLQSRLAAEQQRGVMATQALRAKDAEIQQLKAALSSKTAAADEMFQQLVQQQVELQKPQQQQQALTAEHPTPPMLLPPIPEGEDNAAPPTPPLDPERLRKIGAVATSLTNTPKRGQQHLLELKSAVEKRAEKMEVKAKEAEEEEARAAEEAKVAAERAKEAKAMEMEEAVRLAEERVAEAEARAERAEAKAKAAQSTEVPTLFEEEEEEEEEVEPSGWRAVTDDLGRVYYANDETGESSWVIPEGVVLDDDDEEDLGGRGRKRKKKDDGKSAVWQPGVAGLARELQKKEAAWQAERGAFEAERDSWKAERGRWKERESELTSKLAELEKLSDQVERSLTAKLKEAEEQIEKAMRSEASAKARAAEARAAATSSAARSNAPSPTRTPASRSEADGAHTDTPLRDGMAAAREVAGRLSRAVSEERSASKGGASSSRPSGKRGTFSERAAAAASLLAAERDAAIARVDSSGKAKRGFLDRCAAANNEKPAKRQALASTSEVDVNKD